MFRTPRGWRIRSFTVAWPDAVTPLLYARNEWPARMSTLYEMLLPGVSSASLRATRTEYVRSGRRSLPALAATATVGATASKSATPSHVLRKTIVAGSSRTARKAGARPRSLPAQVCERPAAGDDLPGAEAAVLGGQRGHTRCEVPFGAGTRESPKRALGFGVEADVSSRAGGTGNDRAREGPFVQQSGVVPPVEDELERGRRSSRPSGRSRSSRHQGYDEHGACR